MVEKKKSVKKEEVSPDDIIAENIKILLSPKLGKIVLYDVSKDLIKKIIDVLNTNSDSAVVTAFKHGFVVSKAPVNMMNATVVSKDKEREVNEHMYS